ncbi:MAG: DUF1540 domain-containing protein, partial [Firmicutes bacterium]|nr:DUF1540 domain-containing protein [Bacillota bacterium]
GQGNVCKASEIMVVSDEFGEQQPDQIDATMASQLEPTPVGTCTSTCCKTFVPKDSDMSKQDNIKRMT